MSVGLMAHCPKAPEPVKEAGNWGRWWEWHLVMAVLKVALSRGAAVKAQQVHMGNTDMQVCTHSSEV